MMLGTAAGSGSFVLTLQEEAEILEQPRGGKGGGLPAQLHRKD